MLTRDEKLQLNRLRSLQRRLEEAGLLYDRFGRPDHGAEVEKLKAEIETLPEAVRHFAEREDLLPKFVHAIERFIIHRAALFRDELPDLNTAILNLDHTRDIPRTDIVMDVCELLARLRKAGASQEDIEIAILVAADLTEARSKPVGYFLGLDKAVTFYLDERAKQIGAKQSSGLMSLFSSQPDEEVEDLVQATREWQAYIPEYKANPDVWDMTRIPRDPEGRIAYARFRVMSQIAVLHYLGFDDERIDKEIFEAQNKWMAKQSKKTK